MSASCFFLVVWHSSFDLFGLLVSFSLSGESAFWSIGCFCPISYGVGGCRIIYRNSFLRQPSHSERCPMDWIFVDRVGTRLMDWGRSGCRCLLFRQELTLCGFSLKHPASSGFSCCLCVWSELGFFVVKANLCFLFHFRLLWCLSYPQGWHG